MISALREFEVAAGYEEEVMPKLCILSHLEFEIVIGVFSGSTCNTGRIIDETDHGISNKEIAVGRTKNHAVAVFCMRVEEYAGYERPDHRGISGALSSAEKREFSSMCV